MKYLKITADDYLTVESLNRVSAHFTKRAIDEWEYRRPPGTYSQFREAYERLCWQEMVLSN